MVLEARQEMFDAIGQEMRALRESIIMRDVDGVEGHTAAISEWLQRIKPLLDSKSLSASQADLRELHAASRNTLVLLMKAKRTVQALASVYRVFSPERPSASLESR